MHDFEDFFEKFPASLKVKKKNLMKIIINDVINDTSAANE